MGKQARSVAETEIEAHQFMIAERSFDLHPAPLPANGLFSVTPGRMAIYVGASSGVVTVAVEPRDFPPDAVESEPWDEVCEADLEANVGDVIVQALAAWPPNLPTLTTRGPGTYRVRVHAKGRDVQYDVVAFDPVEEYLIQVWPAAHAQGDIAIKLSDSFGARMRQQSTTSQPSVAARPQPPQRPSTVFPHISDGRPAGARPTDLAL